MATFPERMKSLREQSGMKQHEIANRINVTKQAVSQYERGLRRPDIDTLEAISDLFNVSSDYLLGKSDVTLQVVDEEDLKILRSDRIRKIILNCMKMNEEGIGKVENYIEDLNPKFFERKEEEDA